MITLMQLRYYIASCYANVSVSSPTLKFKIVSTKFNSA